MSEASSNDYDWGLAALTGIAAGAGQTLSPTQTPETQTQTVQTQLSALVPLLVVGGLGIVALVLLMK